MGLFLLAVCIFLAGGILALAATPWPRLSSSLGAGSSVLASLVGLIPAMGVILGGPTESLRWDWEVPYGSFSLALDPLSAFFSIPILILCGLGAVYGGHYLLQFREKKWLGLPWFHYNLLAASMVMVVGARNGVLFLISWEIMALASYFLVVFEDEKEEVRDAGRTYLIATHLGTAFLLVFFVLLGREWGTLDFDRIPGPVSPGTASLMFLAAVIGFGTKAGFMPFHVWLPEAHPAAPSHVSALMSGVMIKTGIYGLVRALSFLPQPPAWWGQLLIGIGIFSGILGILFALAQNDLKRLLAYSTVENAGIICLGLGVGTLGRSMNEPVVEVLGFAGALLHVLNHALFKGLLFFGAGAILHGTGTRDLNLLGGLSRRMPLLAGSFLIGGAAIVGLPPLNGFAGEFLIYLGVFQGELGPGTVSGVMLLGVAAALALTGGLAACALAKAFGMAFLGQPRMKLAEEAHSPGPWLAGPMMVLGAGCVVIGLLSPQVVSLLVPVVAGVMDRDPEFAASPAQMGSGGLTMIVWSSVAMAALVLLLFFLRRNLLSRQGVSVSATWGCGYARPTVRMQYTASSFVQPILNFFGPILRMRKNLDPPAGLFPASGSITTETRDLSRDIIYRPLFGIIGWTLSRFRWFQHGYVHLYVLYVGVTLVALLVWYASVR